VAFLAAAWRPRHVDGLLPFVAVLSVGLAATAAVDIAAGDTSSVREVSHAGAIIGLGLLWSVRVMTGLDHPWGRRRRAEPAISP
jgi:predicted anti-sigma-YlaC factor YlaD